MLRGKIDCFSNLINDPTCLIPFPELARSKHQISVLFSAPVIVCVRLNSTKYYDHSGIKYLFSFPSSSCLTRLRTIITHLCPLQYFHINVRSVRMLRDSHILIIASLCSAAEHWFNLCQVIITIMILINIHFYNEIT